MAKFNFGEGQKPLPDTTPQGVPRGQLKYPLDAESKGILKLALDDISKDVIIKSNRFQLTLLSGTTTFAVSSNYMVMTAQAAVTIATITGGREGMFLNLEFTDANITITDTATAAANTVNLNGSFTSVANLVLQLLYDGTSWREISRGIGARVIEVTKSTTFEASGRYTTAVLGSGANAFGVNGLTSSTGVTLSSSANALWTTNGDGVGEDIFAGSPTFGCSVRLSLGTTASMYIGIGTATVAGSGHTFTTRHIGFKILFATGVASLYATQADGTTENASAALTTIIADDVLEVVCAVNGTISVDYYWRKNGGAFSAATNLTTNLPSAGNVTDCQFSCSNDGTTSSVVIRVFAATYKR